MTFKVGQWGQGYGSSIGHIPCVRDWVPPAPACISIKSDNEYFFEKVILRTPLLSNVAVALRS